MKNRFLFPLLLSLSATLLSAQELAVNLNVQMNRDFNLSKSLRLSASQGLRFYPTILTDDVVVGLLDGVEIIPIDELEEEDDWDEDDDEIGSTPRPNTQRAVRTKTDFVLGWRSVSQVRLRYELTKRLDIAAGYAFFYNFDNFNHVFRFDTQYESFRWDSGFRLSHRLRTQVTKREGRRRLRQDFALRNRLALRTNSDFDYRIDFDLSARLQRGGTIEMRRLRIRPAIRYELADNHHIQFGPFVQFRPDRNFEFSGGISLQYNYEWE